MSSTVFLCEECDIEFRIEVSGSGRERVKFCPLCATPLEDAEFFECEDKMEDLGDEW
jgi:hypothetical protein